MSWSVLDESAIDHEVLAGYRARQRAQEQQCRICEFGGRGHMAERRTCRDTTEHRLGSRGAGVRHAQQTA